jgi:predicted dehydrogenase
VWVSVTVTFAKGFRLSATLEEALADPEVQAIVLATPHSLHADQVVQVARAGKAVFCEKPLSLTRADAQRAVDACKAAGVPIGVGQNKRFWPSTAEMRRVVASGALGRIMHVEGHYSNEHSSKFFAPWRDLPSETPGAGMTGTGIHILDAFANIAGPAEKITAQFIAHRARPRDICLFKFKTTSAAFGSARRHISIHVFGDEGRSKLDERRTIIRLKGGRPRSGFSKIDSSLPIDAFAALPHPITTGGGLDCFIEAINSIKSGTR